MNSFPILTGQGWSLHKKPKFSTIVASHVSGREVRAPQRQYPLWEFEATFDALASDSASYPGLAAQSLQTLMGLFLQCQGQYATFLYFDPTDYSVASQGFAVGDGATTVFQLTRTLGGFVEPVLAPFTPTSLTLTIVPPGPGGSSQYAPNNLLQNSQNPVAALSPFAGTLTGGQADPNSGLLGGQFAETATTAVHYVTQTGATVAGAATTFSVSLAPGASRYVQLGLDNGSVNGAYANFDLQSGAVTASAKYGLGRTPVVTVTPASGGYFRCAISTIFDATSTVWRATIIGVNNTPTAGFAPSYLGATANNFLVAFPQVEQATAAGAPSGYFPTLATRYYGGPIVTVNGVYVDPTGYSVNALTGVITFNAAPASGAVLRWSGWFAYICRFLDDMHDYDQFMQNLWTIKSVKFQSVR